MLDEILTATPIPALRPTLTLALLRQQLYRRNHTSEAPLKFRIARILRPYNISVVHKPITTLRRLLTNQGQRQTGGPTGSSIQDQMLRLPGYLHW